MEEHGSRVNLVEGDLKGISEKKGAQEGNSCVFQAVLLFVFGVVVMAMAIEAIYIGHLQEHVENMELRLRKLELTCDADNHQVSFPN